MKDSKNVTSTKKICQKIGFPVLIKAAGGGGGKGMKVVHKENELERAFALAKTEAKKYFRISSLVVFCMTNHHD